MNSQDNKETSTNEDLSDHKKVTSFDEIMQEAVRLTYEEMQYDHDDLKPTRIAEKVCDAMLEKYPELTEKQIDYMYAQVDAYVDDQGF